MLARLKRSEKRWWGAIILTLLTSLLIIVLRMSGVLELLEWRALDLFFTYRSSDARNSQIVLVTITEDDISYLQEYPLSDRVLVTLLKKIEEQEPSVIGLDMFRNFPVPSKDNNPAQNKQAYSDLIQFFDSTANLIGIAKITDSPTYPSVDPPSILKRSGRVGAADLVLDDDGVVRRGNLFPIADGSAISSTPSLGLAVALNYLSTKNIEPSSTTDGWLKLKNTVFLPFQANDGGYVRTDDSGYQILLDWQSCDRNYFTKVTVREVLQGHILADLFKQRIVLVGNQAISVKDNFATSCSLGTGSTPNTMTGVEIQAHLASQIISDVLQPESPLKVWSDSTEYLWLIFCIATITFWGWKQQKHPNPFKIFVSILCFLTIEAIVLIAISYALFFNKWWIPIVPILLGLTVAAIAIIGSIYAIQLFEAKKNLEAKVAKRTEQLEKALIKLSQFQQQLIIQEKHASLGTLSGRIAHQIKNPLSLISVNNSSSLNLLRELENIIEENNLFFGDIIQEIFQNNERLLIDLQENMLDSQKQVRRVDRIIQDILSYFRQEKIDLVLIEINSLVTEVLKYFAKQCMDFPVNIETNIDNSIGLTKIVPQEIEKALFNLLENAHYAVKNKQKKAKYDYVPTITITTSHLPEWNEIRIRDNGEGIVRDNIAQIFEPFWTNKPPLEGTGLGLFFVRQIIVQMHHGKIEVKSVFGEYSEFIILLPKTI